MSLGADFQVINFIQTRDRPAAVAFYRDVLGLTFVMDDPFASILDQDGTGLRITQIEGFSPSPHPALGWQVSDIQASIRALNAHGVTMKIYEGFGQDEMGIWHAPGGTAKIA
ncbi:VOC family protein [Aquidulcibacter sp.]|uniref:VOC family protein n=1 Tax=Aquidulcibacter sp. TaxID=2052990 RepID=UPI0025BAB4C4|nr:VOC family protein [Aquidulcibacter sp.]MCA3695857.1 VOC family protein [Aquidulcibacter sp.]